MKITEMTFDERRKHLDAWKHDGSDIPGFTQIAIFCGIDCSAIGEDFTDKYWKGHTHTDGKHYSEFCGFVAVLMCLFHKDGADPRMVAHDIGVSQNNWDERDYDVESIENCQAACRHDWEDFKRIHTIEDRISWLIEFYVDERKWDVDEHFIATITEEF